MPPSLILRSSFTLICALAASLCFAQDLPSRPPNLDPIFWAG